jgi:cysteine synthase
MITAAEESGQLHPGDTIVEGTAGNTGIGLAVIGHAKGYRTVIVIPETQSSEKINLLRTLGAEVITVPEKPYSDAENYNRVAQRLAQEKGWFWTNQFDNTANRLRRGCSSAFPPASTLLARCGVPDRPLSPCCAIPG